MIQVESISKRFGETQALHDVSFMVEKGRVVGFLGANGAGKTTTMDIICGSSGADTGIVKVAGFDIASEPLEAKARLGYLPDIPPLYPEMFVEDFIDFSARIHKVPSKQVKTRVDETIDRLSLGDVKRRLIGNLSKGYRQRVALAQALVHNPDVLVLDEPTEGLDPNQIVQIRELIRSLGGQHTVILSSHILSEVQQTCDHIIIIHKGRIVQQGTYEELVANMQTDNLYTLRVAREGSKLLNEIKTLGGVVSTTYSNGQDHIIEFALGKQTDDAIIDTIAKKVVDGGYGLRELSVKKKSLEEVFFSLTK